MLLVKFPKLLPPSGLGVCPSPLLKSRDHSLSRLTFQPHPHTHRKQFQISSGPGRHTLKMDRGFPTTNRRAQTTVLDLPLKSLKLYPKSLKSHGISNPLPSSLQARLINNRTVAFSKTLPNFPKNFVQTGYNSYPWLSCDSDHSQRPPPSSSLLWSSCTDDRLCLLPRVSAVSSP